MTVSYTGDVANASSFGCFNKILFKWTGSVYKLIYKELIAYISLYYVINLFYREVLVPKSDCGNQDCLKWKQSREMFEALRSYCHEQLTSIPLTFVLGFYVSLIVNRWWRQYTLLPWPDSMAIYIVGFLTGKEERQRLMRRNIIRYMLLAYCMAMRTVSFRVKKRFPDLQHLVDAGLMRDDELKVIQELDTKVSANKWFLPLTWATDIIARALAEGNIRPQTVKSVVGELVCYRNQLTGIINHDWVSVPLVYTQVVTLAVYSYFGAALIGAQWINPESSEAYKTAYELPMGKIGTRLDLYYPVFLTVQFVFFFGWLKVAEILINPFGEDDDDFELNRLIDRHTQDRYWDECIPKEIPYTIAAEKFKKEEFQGSAERTLSIKDCDKEYGYVYGMGRYGNANYGNSNSAAPSRNSQTRANNDEPVYGEYGDYGDYESVGTPIIGHKLSWLKKKMGRLDSIRSNKSISSSSTYIGQYLNKKNHHKSQLSLYDKITRKISAYDKEKEKEVKSRKSSRNSKREKLKTQKSQDLNGGVANESFENDPPEENDEDDLNDDDRDFIINKKFLETITENQNSPYSTQASHNTSRRMSAQSIFTDPEKRGLGGTMVRDHSAPILELFHENEEDERATSAFSRKSRGPETYSFNSQRSNESGVHSAEARNSPSTELTSSSSKRSEEVACSALMNALLEDGENLSVSSRGGGNLSVSSRGGGNMSVSSRGRENLSIGSRERDNMSVSSRGRENKTVPNKNMLNNPQVSCELLDDDDSMTPTDLINHLAQENLLPSTAGLRLVDKQLATAVIDHDGPAARSSPKTAGKMATQNQNFLDEPKEPNSGSPSPSIPKRKPVMSYGGIDESKKQGNLPHHQPVQGASTHPGHQGQQPSQEAAAASLYPVHQLKQAENDSQVGSMFDQDIGTVYV